MAFETATRTLGHLYGTQRWKDESLAHRAAHPRCVDCGSVNPRALTVDHNPRALTEAEFWDRTRYETRCWSCHNKKTGREQAARRPSRRRETERHPGLLR